MKKLIFLLTVMLWGVFTQNSNAQPYWNTTGNTLATPPTNFLGTTDANPFEIQVYANQAGWIDYTSPGNTSFGFQALAAVNVGGGLNNTALGYQALNANYSGGGNTAAGYQALLDNYSGGDNTAIGSFALVVNYSGVTNTAVGASSLSSNVTGSANTAVGTNALGFNYSGTGNVATGVTSLFRNSTGNYNVGMGLNSLLANQTGSSNTAIGFDAGAGDGESWNTFLGDSAGWDNGTGEYNTFLGYQAGYTNTWTSVNNSVWIGYLSGDPSGATADYIYLGNNSTSHIQSYNVSSITTWSDRRVKDSIKENVPGLAFITKITPVTFHYNLRKENDLLGVKDNGVDWKGKYDVEKITQSGFIAQQVDSAARACGYNFNGVNRPKTPNGLYSIGYTDFVVPLVKAVQELNARHDSLVSIVDSLSNGFKSLQSCLNQICGATGNNSAQNTGLPATEQNITLNSGEAPLLYQNTPNPFNTGTKINYYLPEGTMGATIIFYDNYGDQIKALQLSQTGNGTLNVTPDNLSNGIYSYSLIVNGNIIDTKKMVLQK